MNWPKTAVLAAAALLVSLPASARIYSFDAVATGAEQAPPVNTPGTATLTATYDSDTRELRWIVTYAGLSGPPTAGHFHGPADIGVNAGVVVPFEDDLASPIEGAVVLTEAQEADLLAGLWYLNLHTAAHPGGEVRAQLIPVELPAPS
ncbi:MAG: CHRD domain-containing protein [Bauldia sp.]|nr:CHRD domain-containing protein [Bauldia sp.]